MKRFFTLLAIALMCCLSYGSYAQLSEGGTPVSFHKKGLETTIPFTQMPGVDVQALMAEDEINNAQKVGPYRFGAELPVNISMSNSGLWEDLKGAGLWREGLRSEGALSMSLIFDNFYLPEGAKLFVYSEDKSQVLGAFTQKNNQAGGYFATSLIAGDAIILEYYEPANVRGQGHFTITTVVHAYRDVMNLLNKSTTASSGACNINVACSLGNGWQNEINAVTRVQLGGGLCTGTLVNNTSLDGTQYYLTANHCYQGSNPATWVFYFNYEASTCNGTSGPSSHTVTGSTFKANNAGSDFALVEINNTIPSNYNPYLAGWRNDNVASSSEIVIHHPQGDIKKISEDQDPVTSASWSGATTWKIGAYEQGTTEPGSSGSPLFDENTHQVIGQLYGGGAACNGSNPNNQPDYYGKFAVSWATGGTSSTELVDWLDPGNTGTTSLTGMDPNAPQVALDAGVVSFDAPEDSSTLCDSTVTPVVTISNHGSSTLTSLTVTLNIDGNNTVQNWTGSLTTGQSTSVNFGSMTLSPGSHTATATVSAPNGGSDQNPANNSASISFNVVIGSTITFTLNTDNYGDETSWDVRDANNNVVYSAPVNTYGDATTYTIDMCLANDQCYTFTIYDAYGDGICCNYGQDS